jgi:hypothetical protein
VHGSIKLPRSLLSAVLDRIAKRDDLKPIGQGAQGRKMSRFPGGANSDDTDAKLHKRCRKCETGNM